MKVITKIPRLKTSGNLRDFAGKLVYGPGGSICAATYDGRYAYIIHSDDHQVGDYYEASTFKHTWELLPEGSEIILAQ